MNNKSTSKKPMHSNKYYISINNNVIDKNSIKENKYLLENLTSLIKKRLTIIYVSLSIYIIHILSFIKCTYKLLTDQYTSGYLISFGFLLGSIVMIFFCFIFCKNHYVTLRYKIDEPSRLTIASMDSALRILTQCHKIWGVDGYEVLSYSNISPNRKEARLLYGKLPWYIKSNFNKCYQLHIGSISYYFLPDKLLIESKNKVTSSYYSQIEIDIDKIAIEETRAAPRDALFLRYTWKYSNKNGGPDKRFKNNWQIPVYLYGVIKFHSSDTTNLNLKLCTSSIQKMVDSMKQLSDTNVNIHKKN